MKRQLNKRGFVLVLLIFFIGIIGIETVILSGISGTMAFEANQAYLQAGRENLVVSGLTWVKANADKAKTNEAVELDVGSLGLHRAELKVIVRTGRKEANILACCSAARQTLRINDKYSF